MEYVFKTGNIIHTIQYAKESNNVKLGAKSPILKTYHFGIEQVLTIGDKDKGLKMDVGSCLDCPLSYTNNNGKSGKCYTHNGMQRLGLNAKLDKLHRLYVSDQIQEFDLNTFYVFLDKLRTKQIDLVRFGVYGEPVLLPLPAVMELVRLSSYTGYTHQWNKPEYQMYRHYFMASTHNQFEVSIANDMGWRVFNVGILDSAVNCPASKEAGHKTVCASCNLCNGADGNSNKNIYIKQH